MININRPKQSPPSLQTQAVKDYLDNVAAWRSDPTLPKPDSNLPAYRNSDLIEAFDDCFFAKCYLTEKKFVSSYEMDIEHFLSKNFDAHPELRYEWTNLYPADHDANMAKPRITLTGGYLDPCNPDDDVENELFYWLKFDGKTCHFKAIDEKNIKAKNTAKLLDKLHNGDDEISKQKTGGLRQALFDKREKINQTIMDWLRAKADGDSDTQNKKEIQLRWLLSREQSYTMLMRSTSAVKRHVPKEFLD